MLLQITRRLLCFFLFSSLLFGQGYNSHQVTTFTTTGTATPIRELGVSSYHQILWSVTGSPASCSVRVDSSVDDSTWVAGGIITAQTCTSSGSSSLTGSVVANYIRVDVTALSASATLTVTYNGYATNPSGGGSPGGVNGNWQVKNGSAFAGVTGTGADTTNGTVVVAPGSGAAAAAMVVKDDGQGTNDVLDLFDPTTSTYPAMFAQPNNIARAPAAMFVCDSNGNDAVDVYSSSGTQILSLDCDSNTGDLIMVNGGTIAGGNLSATAASGPALTAQGVGGTDIADFKNYLGHLTDYFDVNGVLNVPSCVGCGSAGGVSAIGLVDQSVYGVKADTKWINDGTLSTANATMDCTHSNDCNFTSADVGKVCFANTTSGNILPIGTISAVLTAQTATCSGGDATANSSHAAAIIWGSDDDAALNAADAAVFAQCGGLQIHGMILVKTGKFRSISSTSAGCNNNGSNGGPGHAEVVGNGQINTYLIPRPDFTWTSCNGTGATGSPSCFGPGGTAVAEFRNFSIDGFNSGNNGVGATSGAYTLFADSFFVDDMTLYGWCASPTHCPNLGGITFTNNAASAARGGSALFGNWACGVGALQVSMGPNWACINGTGGIYGLLIGGGTSVFSVNSYFSGNTDAVNVLSGGTFYSLFDEYANAGTISIAGTAYLNGYNLSNNTGNSGFPIGVTATGKAYVKDSQLNPASGHWATVASGGLLVDQGGNSVTGGVAVTGSGVFIPSTPTSGPTFTSSGGLDEGSLVGYATGGQFTTATLTSGSTVITMGGGMTALHGWSCSAGDTTHPADAIEATPTSTSTVTLTVASAITASDVIWFGCQPY